MQYFLFLFVFLWLGTSAVHADNVCTVRKKELHNLDQICKAECEERKASKKCQDLYSRIERESGAEIMKEKVLKCEGAASEMVRTIQNAPLGCLIAGYDVTVGSVVALGQALGETTAKAVMSIQKDLDRQAECDKNVDQKKKMFTEYNKMVPKLLKIRPKPETFKNIATISCAQLETEIYFSIKEQEKAAATNDYILLQTEEVRKKSPPPSADVAEYLEWKDKKLKLAQQNSQTIFDSAEALLDKYNIGVDCYEEKTAWALRCEAALIVMTGMTGLSRKLISAMSGVKIDGFLYEVGKHSNLKKMSDADKLKMLQKAKELEDAERLAAAEKMLNHPLSADQNRVLMEAHYNKKTLREKAAKLREEFTEEEQDLLMRSGLAGVDPVADFQRSLASKAPNTTGNPYFSKVEGNFNNDAIYQSSLKPVLAEKDAIAALKDHAKKVGVGIKDDNALAGHASDSFNKNIGDIQNLNTRKERALKDSGGKINENIQRIDANLEIEKRRCQAWFSLYQAAGFSNDHVIRNMQSQIKNYCK